MTSRIFVRGLPPTLSQDEFRKHFSWLRPVTDARLFPHRRIGYVGYSNAEDASKAVKYFNKSFIRMSRIAVELARPISGEAPRKPDKPPIVPAATDGHPQNDTISNSNPLKRKRNEPLEIPQDPKLEEYLRVMQRKSKKENFVGEGQAPVNQGMAKEEESTTVEVAQGASDDEYEDVRRIRKSKHDKGREPTTSTSSNIAPPDVSSTPKSPIPGPIQEQEGSGTTYDEHKVPSANEVPVSDSDWLRSRTSRLLGLTGENDEEEGSASTEEPDAELAEKPLNQSVQDIVPPEPEADPKNVEPSGVGELQSELANETDDVRAIRGSGRLFVRNLPYTVTEEALREQFAAMDGIDEVHVPLDRKSGAGKGFAYIQFADPQQAVHAYESMDGQILQGRLLHVLPGAKKRETTLDEYALSKLPLKKQRQIQKKAEAATATFNWNSLYISTDSVMASIADRLGVAKSDLLDPTSSDAAVKQAHAETHVIQETKAYFENHGVDLNAFKRNQRGDTAILVKNFPYGTSSEELNNLFKPYGEVTRLLFPPSGTIAIVELANAAQAKAAFSALAYRKIKHSLLFLEKAPKDLFKGTEASKTIAVPQPSSGGVVKPSTSDLLNGGNTQESPDATTLFVRNLNFSTTTERLTEVFKPLDGFLSARVKTKTDAKRPGQLLSMGFGFLEFRTKSHARAALAAMDGYNLDGHALSIKASHKGLDAAEERRKEDRAKKAAGRNTKIIVKNLPFEASKKDVRALFGAYGQLRTVRVPKKFDSSTRGFAFADFTTSREAENAMDALRNTHLLGRRLVLEYAAVDPEDAEEEIQKMQGKVGRQANQVALQKMIGSGRKKFTVGDAEQMNGE